MRAESLQRIVEELTWARTRRDGTSVVSRPENAPNLARSEPWFWENDEKGGLHSKKTHIVFFSNSFVVFLPNKAGGLTV